MRALGLLNSAPTCVFFVRCFLPDDGVDGELEELVESSGGESSAIGLREGLGPKRFRKRLMVEATIWRQKHEQMGKN